MSLRWIDSSIRIRLKTGSNGEPPTLAEEIDDLETEAEDEEGDAREISEAIEVEEAKEAAKQSHK